MSNDSVWTCSVRYVDNPAGPIKGRIELRQEDKPVRGQWSFGPFGRCIIKTVRKVKGGVK